MSLYEHLAPVYDELFPVNPATIAFLAELLGRGAREPEVVDLGAATGGHLLALARLGWRVSGIEFSHALVERGLARLAAAGIHPLPELIEGDMRRIASYHAPGSLDLVLCLGNTLPHLGSREEVENFLLSVRETLRPGGRLVLQLLNFALVAPGTSLPLIETAKATFIRSYSRGEGGELLFETRLDLGEGRSYSDRTALLPLTLKDLAAGLERAGFVAPQSWAGWNREPFVEAGSPYLILVAER